MSRLPTIAIWMITCSSCVMAADAPTTVPALDELPKLPDNAALQYWPAFSALSSHSPDMLRAAKPGDSWTQELVDANSLAIKYLRRGGAMPSANWGLAYDQGTFALVPHLDKAKHLAQAGLLWARVAASEKRFDDALNVTADVLGLARHTAGDPLHMALAVAGEIQADAVQQVAEQLPAMPKETLTRFSARLKALPPLPGFDVALRTQQLLVGQSLRIYEAKRAASTRPDEEYPERMRGWLTEIQQLYNEQMRISLLPPDQWPAAEAEFRKKMFPTKNPLIGNLMLGMVFKNNHAVARSQIRFSLLEAAVAVMQEGPDAAGRFTDPYLHKAIKYQEGTDGFELLSEVPIEGKPVSLRISRAEGAAIKDEGFDQATAAARVFRTQATLYSAPMRIYVNEADGLGDDSRVELLRMLDDYDSMVDAQVAQVRKHPIDLNELIHRAETMGAKWDDGVMQKWLAANPDAQTAVESSRLVLQNLADLLFADRERIVAAANQAGLEEPRRLDAAKIVEEACAGIQAYGMEIQKQQEKRIRLSPDDPRHLDGMTILADVEMEKLRTARTIRQQIRALLPPERRGQFDEELTTFAAPAPATDPSGE